MKLCKISMIIPTLLLSATSLFAAFGTMSISSSTHDTTNQSKATDVVLSWAAPTVDGTTVLNGYYYKMDKSSSTLMSSNDTLLSDTSTSKTQTITDGDGSYYFHIAPYATNGDIGATAHFGPIKIDTTAPTALSITPDGGSFNSVQTVSMSATDANNYTLYYTTDNSTPSASNGNTYTSAITVAANKTIKIIAIDSAGNSSSLKSSSFTINTTTNVAQFGNEVNAGSTIATNSNGNSESVKRTISVEGSAVTNYKYKIDTASFGAQIVKSTPIDISSLADGTHTISIVGYDGSTWQADSAATTLTFTVDNTSPSAITFSTASGTTITSNTTITISSLNSKNIYYTTDGSTPTTSSTNSSTLALTSSDSSVTLKAIAYDEAKNKTSVAQAVYTVNISAPSSTGSTGTTSTPTTTTDTTTTDTTTTDTTTTDTTTTDTTTTTDITSIVTPTGETVEIGVTTNLDTASTVTNADGTKTITATTTAADGEALETKVNINLDGTLKNTFTIGNNISDIKVDIVGADTTIGNDGSMVTVAKITAQDGSIVAPRTEVKADGSTVNAIEITDKNGVKITSNISIAIAGADTTVRVDGSIETIAEVISNNGIKTVATVELTADGSTSNKLNVTDTTGNIVQTQINTAIVGSNSAIADDGSVTITTPSIVTTTGESVVVKIVANNEGTITPTLSIDNSAGIVMPNFEAGSIVDIKHENGKVLLEVKTKLTKAITFN